MNRMILGLLTSIGLVCAPIVVTAQVQTPVAVVPIIEFVAAIEDGGYASFDLPPVTNYAPLDLATFLFISTPNVSLLDSINNPNTLLSGLIIDLDAFNNYWVLSGSSASLFTPTPLGVDGIDTPQIDAHYITNALNAAEQNQQFKAPEIDAASMASALTLLLGALVVLRGRRATLV